METTVDLTRATPSMIDYLKYLSCNLDTVFCNHLYNTMSF